MSDPMTAAVSEPTLEGKLTAWFAENLTYDHFRDWSDAEFAAVLAPLVVEVRERAVEEAALRVEASAWCKCTDAYCSQRATITAAARIVRGGQR